MSDTIAPNIKQGFEQVVAAIRVPLSDKQKAIIRRTLDRATVLGLQKLMTLDAVELDAIESELLGLQATILNYADMAGQSVADAVWKGITDFVVGIVRTTEDAILSRAGLPSIQARNP